MTRAIRIACCAFLLASLSAGQASATDQLVPYSAEYRVKISILGGDMKTDVRRTADGFAARSVITPTGFANLFMSGSIEEYSEFSVDDDGVHPHHYESSDTLSKDNAHMLFDFDYDANTVNGTIDDTAFHFDFDRPVHDRVSIQFELMHNLLKGDRGTQYALLDGDELKKLVIRNIGTKTVKVPFGRFEAVGIQHQAVESSRVSTLWCVRELGYLPVIIEQHRNGKLKVRAVLTKYTPGEPADNAQSR